MNPASLSSPVVHYVTASDGVRLAVHDWGGGGSVVLLTHGNGLCARAADPLASLLAASGLRVLVPDARGHGLSAGRAVPPALDVSWRRFGQDVLDVAAGLHITRCFGLGHSLGGCALLFAAAERRDLFASLYLFEPIVALPEDAALRWKGGSEALAAGAARRRRAFASRDAARAAWASKPPFSTFDARSLDSLVAHGLADAAGDTVVLRCAPETEAAVFRVGSSADAKPALARVLCPVTVAYGALAEREGPALAAPIVAAGVDGGRGTVRRFERASHFGPYEIPEAVGVAALAAFAMTAKL